MYVTDKYRRIDVETQRRKDTKSDGEKKTERHLDKLTLLSDSLTK